MIRLLVLCASRPPFETTVTRPRRRRLDGRQTRWLILPIACFCCSCSSSNDQQADATPVVQPAITQIDVPSRILFIGNSLTYSNHGLEWHLLQLVRAADPYSKLVIEARTAPNETVAGHLRKIQSSAALGASQWDVVVVQGASYEAVDERTAAGFQAAVRGLAQHVRRAGADVALFMTWSFRSHPSMINALRRAYVQAGNDNSVIVIPVGIAWRDAGNAGFRDKLYADDRHPTLRGTYLSACVFYAVLMQASPVGNAYHAGLPATEAMQLQRIALGSAREFYVAADAVFSRVAGPKSAVGTTELN